MKFYEILKQKILLYLFGSFLQMQLEISCTQSFINNSKLNCTSLSGERIAFRNATEVVIPDYPVINTVNSVLESKIFYLKRGVNLNFYKNKTPEQACELKKSNKQRHIFFSIKQKPNQIFEVIRPKNELWVRRSVCLLLEQNILFIYKKI